MWTGVLATLYICCEDHILSIGKHSVNYYSSYYYKECRNESDMDPNFKGIIALKEL